MQETRNLKSEICLSFGGSFDAMMRHAAIDVGCSLDWTFSPPAHTRTVAEDCFGYSGSKSDRQDRARLENVNIITWLRGPEFMVKIKFSFILLMRLRKGHLPGWVSTQMYKSAMNF